MKDEHGYGRARDNSSSCKNGHPRTPENTAWYTSQGMIKRVCRICYRQSHNNHMAETKLEVLSHYGPEGRLQCSWPDCIIIDVDMLSIDHINNDGANDRKTLNSGGKAMYAWLKAHGFPSGFQTLCHNHQWKKELMRRRGEQ